jgi:hypothetical protein
LTPASGWLPPKIRGHGGGGTAVRAEPVGRGLGPLITGHLRDWWPRESSGAWGSAVQASADGITYALICMLLATILAIVFYLRAARTVRQELTY